MKKHTKGFTLLEILLVTVIFGIIFTVAIPNFLGHLDKSYDTERIATLNKASRIMQMDMVENNHSMIITDLAGFKASLDKRGMPAITSNSVHCYVFGHRYDSFFIAVQSASDPGTFLVNGTPAGQSEFVLEDELRSEILSCSPLTSPTEVSDYDVFYVQ